MGGSPPRGFVGGGGRLVPTRLADRPRFYPRRRAIRAAGANRGSTCGRTPPLNVLPVPPAHRRDAWGLIMPTHAPTENEPTLHFDHPPNSIRSLPTSNLIPPNFDFDPAPQTPKKILLASLGSLGAPSPNTRACGGLFASQPGSSLHIPFSPFGYE